MIAEINYSKSFLKVIGIYPLTPDPWTFLGYNDRPAKCPHCKKGVIYPTYTFNLGWCDSCHYFWGWGYIKMIEEDIRYIII